MARQVSFYPQGTADEPQVSPREALARAMILRGTSTEPVYSPLQGLARALQAPIGAYIQRGERERSGQEAAAQQEASRQALAEALALSQGAPGMMAPGGGPAGGGQVTPSIAGDPMAAQQRILQDPRLASMAQDKILAQILAGQEPEAGYTLSPGQARFQGGRQVAALPAAPDLGSPYTLGPGQRRYSPTGELLSEVPPAPSTEGRLTPTMQANNDEIDAARRVLMSLGPPAQVMAMSEEMDPSGLPNPNYNSNLRGVIRKALERKTGGDPEFNRFYQRYLGPQPQPPAPPAPAPQPGMLQRMGNLFRGSPQQAAPPSGAPPAGGMPVAPTGRAPIPQAPAPQAPPPQALQRPPTSPYFAPAQEAPIPGRVLPYGQRIDPSARAPMPQGALPQPGRQPPIEQMTFDQLRDLVDSSGYTMSDKDLARVQARIEVLNAGR